MDSSQPPPTAVAASTSPAADVNATATQNASSNPPPPATAIPSAPAASVAPVTTSAPSPAAPESVPKPPPIARTISATSVMQPALLSSVLAGGGKRPFRVNIEQLGAQSRRVVTNPGMGGNAPHVVRMSQTSAPLVIRPPVMPVISVVKPPVTTLAMGNIREKTLSVQSPGGTSTRAYTFQMGVGALAHQRQSPLNQTANSQIGVPSPLSAARVKAAAAPVLLQRHQIQLPSTAQTGIGARFVAAPGGLPLRSNHTTQPIGMARHSSMPVSGTSSTRLPMPGHVQRQCLHPQCNATCLLERTADSPKSTLQPPTGNGGGTGTGQSPRPSILRKRAPPTPSAIATDTPPTSTTGGTVASRKLVYTAPSLNDLSTDPNTKKLPLANVDDEVSNGDSGSNSDPSNPVVAPRPQSTLTSATHPPPTPEPPRANSVNDALNINDLLSPRKRMRKQQFNPEDQSATRLYITQPVSQADIVAQMSQSQPVYSNPPVVRTDSSSQPTLPAAPIGHDNEPETMSDDTQSVESTQEKEKPPKKEMKRAAVSPVVNFGRPLNFDAPKRSPVKKKDAKVETAIETVKVEVEEPEVEYRLRPRLLAAYEPTWNARHAHMANGEVAADMTSIFYDPKTGDSRGLTRVANDKRTWQLFEEESMDKLKRQMAVVAEREDGNARMLQEFITDFVDHDMHEDDATLPMARVSTNQRETMRELILCNVQRQRALKTDIEQCITDMDSIVEKHDERVQRKLARFASTKRRAMADDMIVSP